jgi:hypothetical protein
MNIYNTITAAVTTRQAAEHFGLAVDKHGMALCPFHEDRKPSLRLNRRYYCFGCHATGDVIDFTARLQGISHRQAAENLAEIFGKFPKPPTQSHIPKSDAELFREKEQFCIRVLWDYLRLLRYWKLRYAPESPGDSYDGRFVEACQMESVIAHLSDEMREENVSRRKRIIELLEQDNRIYDLENYVSRRKVEEMQLEGE